MGCEDLASSENKYKQSLFKTPFWDPFQNRKPDLKVCGERTWLPIYKNGVTLDNWFSGLDARGLQSGLQRFCGVFSEQEEEQEQDTWFYPR